MRRNRILSELVVLLCGSKSEPNQNNKHKESRLSNLSPCDFSLSLQPRNMNVSRDVKRDSPLLSRHDVRRGLILQLALALALALVFNLWRSVFGISQQLLKVNSRCEVAVYLCCEADTCYVPRAQVSSVAN